MNLTIYVETLREHLIAAAETGGDESKALVERLSAGLDVAARLVLLETLSAAADEITAELAPGAVEVRLRGSDPEFVVVLPSQAVADQVTSGLPQPIGVVPGGDEDGGTSRLNLRLPEGLKARIEEAANREGLSLNAWLVRIAAAVVDGSQGHLTRTPAGSQRYEGWVR